MATTNTFTAAPINDTDADYRAWGNALSAAFASLGLVKDTDASQVNWATVSKPATSSTITDYEIWRFNDGALQTACPVYFKVNYGNIGGVGGTTIPGIILQVGQGSNNAGTLTGTQSTAGTFGCNSSSGTSYNCFVSSDGGHVSVAMFVGNTNTAWAFYIERVKDDTGVETSAGINIVIFGSSSGSSPVAVVTQQYLPVTGAAYPATPMTSPMCALPSSGAASYGSNVGLFPIYPNLGYAANPDLGALVYFTGDISSAGAIITVSLYGTNHNFVTLGATTPAGALALNGNTTAHSLAMRYE